MLVMGFQTPHYDKLVAGWAERKTRMLKMRSQGVSDSEIGRKLGISRSRVLQILGAKRPRKPQTVDAIA